MKKMMIMICLIFVSVNLYSQDKVKIGEVVNGSAQLVIDEDVLIDAYIDAYGVTPSSVELIESGGKYFLDFKGNGCLAYDTYTEDNGDEICIFVCAGGGRRNYFCVKTCDDSDIYCVKRFDTMPDPYACHCYYPMSGITEKCDCCYLDFDYIINDNNFNTFIGNIFSLAKGQAKETCNQE